MESATNYRIRTYVLGILLLSCLFYCPSSLQAQTLQDTIVSYFDRIKAIPQEKLYLHLDKPFYGAGENIWFKGYLVNAIDHKNKAFSNFIYTELINRDDSVVLRKKIRRDSIGCFQGSFTLPAELPQGDYYLRGYSNWMKNEDADFFYSRNLKIGNSIDISILSSIEYQQEDEKSYIGKIRFTNQENTPFRNIKIRYTLFNKGKRTDRGTVTTNEDGSIRVKLPDLYNRENTYKLNVVFLDDQYKYDRTFYLPNLSTDYDVSFFPEGGDLLTITSQIIAFKAQGANGLSKQIAGFVLTATGDTISTIRTEHDGMGFINLTPRKGVQYYAETISPEGVKKRFDLPEVKEQGFSLSLSHYKKEIRYHIQKTATTPWPENLFLIAHTRGEICIFKKVNPENPLGKIDDHSLQEGITHFLLVDGDGIPRSERLYFVRHEDQGQWKITPDRNKYGRREKVSVAISATGNNGLPLSGDFSVSITDAASVRPDSLSDHILANLLLTSDLKGYIENPGYYFLSADKKRTRDLDLVMLTHGWKRFKIANLKTKPEIKTDHYIEAGQIINGRIKGFFGGKVKQGPIIAIAPKQNITKMVNSDEQGEFLIDGISFPDSTTFIVQARTKRGYAGVDILIDSITFPEPYNKNRYQNDSIRFMDDYLINTREKYYTEGGMRVINLKEVVVRAERKKSTENNIYTGMSDYTVDSERLEMLSGQTVFDVVSRVPGVRVVNGNQIQIRGSNSSPIIVVDGIIYEDDDSILDSTPVTDIEQLDVLKGANASIFGMRGSGGAIIIELKSGKKLATNSKPSPGILTLSPMGYSKCVEFYHPKYDTPQQKSNHQPDLRTTLYWNPSLIFNAEGKVVIDYYTSDNSTSQDIVIEGIDTNGSVYRYSSKVVEE